MPYAGQACPASTALKSCVILVGNVGISTGILQVHSVAERGEKKQRPVPSHPKIPQSVKYRISDAHFDPCRTIGIVCRAAIMVEGPREFPLDNTCKSAQADSVACVTRAPASHQHPDAHCVFRVAMIVSCLLIRHEPEISSVTAA